MLRRIDPVLLLLFAGLLIFTIILLICEKMFYQDAQIFQVIAAIVTGFAGALFGRMKPENHNHDQPPTPPSEAPKA